MATTYICRRNGDNLCNNVELNTIPRIIRINAMGCNIHNYDNLSVNIIHLLATFNFTATCDYLPPYMQKLVFGCNNSITMMGFYDNLPYHMLFMICDREVLLQMPFIFKCYQYNQYITGCYNSNRVSGITNTFISDMYTCYM